MDSSSGCSMDCPMENQKTPETSNLSQERETSSIPSSSGKPWIYPSEQMFFNAMKRKNKDPKEKDMHTIIPIHNQVNEECWKRIRDWERVNGTSQCETKLIKFKGRANDFTIRARLFNLLGYQLPFDRHDWVVDRCGTQITYIIDFYAGARDSVTNRPLSFYLDVRPAVTFQGIIERMNYFWKTQILNK